VRLFLEENYTQRMIADEFGVGKSTIGHWVRRYRNEGEEGLRDRPVPKRKPTAKKSLVREKIVETKLANPRFGIRRIRDTLRRFLLLKTSAETVRKTLHAEGLADPPQAKKPRRSDPKPRFFERSTPNQLWQTDIFTFRLAGKNAYLIGFIDDYSRYLVGLQLYRSQTAEHVLETYRTAVGEYGVPKEMLTDNGRQYTNWRGTTRFEKEMAKDRVKHFRSRPHHPMTLGKIERFWVLEDHLGRVPLARAVRHVRGGARARGAVVQVLQPPPPAPGHRLAVPGRSVLRGPGRTAHGHRARRRGQRAGTGAARW
jgi:transposase InsO family protein